MRRARVPAPAKVNLLLRILHRRADGFHELETVFQAVSLADEVEVELGGDGIRLEVDGPDLGPPGDNLAVRAARAFRASAEMEEGVRVLLRKRIPAGAGLGGGSSDAAAVLRALDALAGPRPPGELLELGAELGSDVPFFLGPSPLAAATGRGEKLRAWEPLPATWLVLVMPPVHVATGEAYGALARLRAEEGADQPGRAPTSRGAPGPGAHQTPRLPPPARSWSTVLGWCGNDFEDVVPRLHPPVARALEALGEAGGRGVLLSGSGAACLGFFPGGEAGARDAAASLAVALGWPVRAVRTLERFPRVETDGLEGG